MSYILDSIKKSDQERSGIDINAPEQLKTPPYLEAPMPKKDKSMWLYMMVGFVIACFCLYLIFFLLPSHRPVSYTQADAVSIQSVPSAVIVEATPPPAPTVITEPKQIIANDEKSAAVDSLYESREQQTIVDTSEILPSTLSPPEKIPVENEPAIVVEPKNTNKTETVVVNIPSVFSLDVATQRNIPDVEYGAHIYANDNNSGFVILNGAKKQVGDRLRNGIFIEKINEEDVVLSFNGLLFTLPALKSWSYQ